MGLSARVSARCTNLMRFAVVRRSSEPVNGADVYVHEVGEMSGRVSWQRLALIRGQLTDETSRR